MSVEELLIQGGFAGLAVVLCGAVAWIGKAFIAEMHESRATIVGLAKQSNDVVRDNTEAINDLRVVNEEHNRVSEKLHDQLLQRPCMIPKQQQAGNRP